MIDYVRDPSGEKGFEIDFGYHAPTFGCYYDKQKDPRITKGRYLKMKERKRLGKPALLDEVRRSYDGNLFTRFGNFPIEFKFNDGALSPHQKVAQEAIDRVNNSFFILRKVVQYINKKIVTKYLIQKRISERIHTVFQTDKFEDIYRWFNGIIGKGEEHISYFIKWR